MFAQKKIDYVRSRTRKYLTLVMVIVIAVVFSAIAVSAQGPTGGKKVPSVAVSTAFTYQGQLKKNGTNVTSSCNFQFSLWDSAILTFGQLGGTQTINNVSVSNGLFTVTLNSGGEFGGSAFIDNQRFLEIAAQCAGDSGFTTLSRQYITATPFALALPGLYTQQNTTSPNIIGGFNGNNVSPGVVGATISGGGVFGAQNSVFSTANYSTISGGSGNTIAGGGLNATVGGGYNNLANSDFATVGGGFHSIASQQYATVGGGRSNTANGKWSTVGGGDGNTTSNYYATVSGGINNTSGYAATVGGGSGNTASGSYATVPGGVNNTASGSYSFAAGCTANAAGDGSFVFADSNCDMAGLPSSPNAFVVRVSGGAAIFTHASGLPLAGVQVFPGGTSWSVASDRNVKANFAPVNGRDILLRLASIPVQTWNSKSQDPSIRHIGPMAQDFYAAFNVGEDDTHITTIDADGVAFAAIQGLYQITQEKDAEIQNLKHVLSEVEASHAESQSRIEALQKQNADLDARLSAIEQSLQANSVQVRAASNAIALPDGLSAPIWILVGMIGLVVIQRAQRRSKVK